MLNSDFLMLKDQLVLISTYKLEIAFIEKNLILM